MIHAFKQIRLTNTLMTVTGDLKELQVGAEKAVYQSATGAFLTTGAGDGRYALSSNTGSFVTTSQTGQFYAATNPSQFISSGNADLKYVPLTGDVAVNGRRTFNADSPLGNGGIYFGNGAAIYNLSNVKIIDVNASTLYAGDVDSIQFGSRRMYDSGSNMVLDWENKTLGTELGADTLNWSKKQLTGTWSAGGLTISGNPVLTGLATGNFITSSQTGQFVWTGSQQSFATLMPSGLDTTGILFPVPFTSVPKVQTTVEVFGDTMYAVNIKLRTVNGYTAIFSDVIAETGVYLHTFASI